MHYVRRGGRVAARAGHGRPVLALGATLVLGAAIGALDIFLLQSALTYFNFSTFVLQIAYGTILVVAIVLTAVQDRLLGRRAG